MGPAARSFQVFAKPAGSACNLACPYCYYFEKPRFDAGGRPARMSDSLLEEYIVQHIAASPDEVIRFSWHGGEPTIMGTGFFRKAVELQRRHCPAGRQVANGLQTNGTLIDEEWGAFLAEAGFSVGLSLDGPRELHDAFRLSRDGRPTFDAALRGYGILRKREVPTDILCVVHARNVLRPSAVYGFFKSIEAPYVSFLPLVEPQADAAAGVASRTVPAEAWGEFLCDVFDEWREKDIGRIKVQIIEEAARTAFGQEHSLCIFRPVCGDIPVVEHNGDFYPCDHFVDEEHRLGNIRETALDGLLESPRQQEFGRAKIEKLPQMCRACEVRDMCNGECPKNRFCLTPEGEPDLNFLCAGYRRFFNHCRPFVEAVAAEWRRGGS